MSGAYKIVNTVAALEVEVGMVATGKKAVGKVKLKISEKGTRVKIFNIAV